MPPFYIIKFGLLLATGVLGAILTIMLGGFEIFSKREMKVAKKR